MTALANKYRPKKIADLIGQDAPVRILTNSIKTGKIHHAYIFSGKFGCGKTSAARILAASINGKNGPTLEPDLSDPDILAIFEGKSIDIKEIDAASQRSIDDIRELQDIIRYAPLRLKYRFVIIDEAHRLTGAAAEAALKMIEEPPENVIFILCTTDAEKLKDTIHSRCMPLRFNKVSWDQIFLNLKKVATAENIECDENALKIAARLSKGSVRNSLQNLQMMITFASGQKITPEIAQQSLSTVDENKFFDLVDAILKPDAGEAMRIIDNILGDGRDVGEVLDALVGHIRTMLVIKTCKDTSKLLFLTEEEKKRYSHQCQNMTIPLLMQMIDLVAKCFKGVALNINVQTMLEQFVIGSIIFSRTENKTVS
jgi:DNA polymerase-3 subunit gamma/tau